MQERESASAGTTEANPATYPVQVIFFDDSSIFSQEFEIEGTTKANDIRIGSVFFYGLLIPIAIQLDFFYIFFLLILKWWYTGTHQTVTGTLEIYLRELSDFLNELELSKTAYMLSFYVFLFSAVNHQESWNL